MSGGTYLKTCTIAHRTVNSVHAELKRLSTILPYWVSMVKKQKDLHNYYTISNSSQKRICVCVESVAMTTIKGNRQQYYIIIIYT